MTWREHLHECPTCWRAHMDIAALRRGELDRSRVTVACPVGIRLMPIEDVDVATPLTKADISAAGAWMRDRRPGPGPTAAVAS